MANLDNIVFDDVLAEIEKLTDSNPEGFTISEMSEAVHHTEEWCRKKIRQLIKGGQAKCNGRAKRMRIDGAPAFVPVYAFLQR